MTGYLQTLNTFISPPFNLSFINQTVDQSSAVSCLEGQNNQESFEAYLDMQSQIINSKNNPFNSDHWNGNQVMQTYEEVRNALGKEEFEKALEKVQQFGSAHLKALDHIHKQIKYTQAKFQKNPSSQKFYPTSLSQIFKDSALQSDKLYKTLAMVGKNLRKNPFPNAKHDVYMPYYAKQVADQTYGFAIDKKGYVYIEGQKIGEGGFKQVAATLRMDRSSQQDRLDGYVIARMKVNPQNSLSEQELQKEVDNLAYVHDLKIPNIVPAYKVAIYANFGQPCVLVQKKMDGDGKDLMKDNTFLPSDIFSVMLDVNQGLAAMHNYKKNQELGDGNQQVGILHNDIKPANILFKRTKERIKGFIHDFGLMTKPGELSRHGSLYYMPPEKLRALALNRSDTAFSTEKVDSFAVGCTILELLTRKEQHYFDQPIGVIADQQEMDQFLANIEQNVKIDTRKYDIKNNYNLEPKEQAKQLKEIETEKHLLSAAKELLKINPQQRISCKEAKEKMEAFKHTFSTLP